MYRRMCDICNQNPATHRVINFTNTKKQVQDICDDCYRKRQQSNALDILKSVASGSGTVKKTVQPQHVCRVCGTTSSSFLKTGLVGCDNCYVDLAPEILKMIRATQGEMNHLGKSPIDAEQFKPESIEQMDIKPEPVEEVEKEESPESKRLQLKKALELAVQLEEYEKAIELRDELAAMTEENEDA